MVSFPLSTAENGAAKGAVVLLLMLTGFTCNLVSPGTNTERRNSRAAAAAVEGTAN